MIWIILGALFVFLGIAIHKLKWYFLIAGYNTMSLEEKSQVDIENLSKIMAYYMYAIAGVFLGVAIIDRLELSQFMLPCMMLIVVISIAMAIHAQKFSHSSMDRSNRKKNVKKSISISMLTLIGVGVIIYFSVQPTAYTLHDTSFEISGMYGDEIAYTDITELVIVEELPNIKSRTNGSAVGSKLKGHFKFENGEKAKLFVDESKPPFIKLSVNGNLYYFNSQTQQETEELFQKISKKRGSAN